MLVPPGVSSGWRERSITPIQPHKAGKEHMLHLNFISPPWLIILNRLIPFSLASPGPAKCLAAAVKGHTQTKKEILHVSTHTGLMQVLPGHPLADSNPGRSQVCMHVLDRLGEDRAWGPVLNRGRSIDLRGRVWRLGASTKMTRVRMGPKRCR